MKDYKIEPLHKYRIEVAPAVYRGGRNGEPKITDTLLTEDEANGGRVESLIKWPADFDKERGVWYYEWTEGYRVTQHLGPEEE